MYTICNPIYGYPYTRELAKLFGPDELEEHGFQFLYSGCSEIEPGFIGVELGEFNGGEAPDFGATPYSSSRDSEALPKATEEQKSEANKKIEALPEAIREHVGPVDNWLIWGTS